MGKGIMGIDTADYSITIKAKMELMENGPILFETAHRHKNGSLIPIEVKGRLIQSGGKKFILGVSRDITERKKVEEELRESENKYKVLTENSLTGIFIAQDEKFIYVNGKFAEMHGYKPVELIEKEIWMLIFR
jgi:PAS domain-containing protein